MVRELQGLLPDFGEKLAFDGKAIEGPLTGKRLLLLDFCIYKY
jgi:hypothetical protein